ncbi:T9SS type A sorting domain-containing protein [bacterium]|nr:T9SS type A sorting domain-containing protein [bacterium]
MKRLMVLLFALALAGAAFAGEWHIETVDSDGVVGSYTSLALDSSGRPHISYYDYASGNGNLKYAHWNGSSWQIETVDSEGRVGLHTSLALDSSGRPHISYYDYTNTALKYARWNGSSWQVQTVDSAGHVGSYTSLALDSNDYPHIAYSDNPNNDLKYACWDGAEWRIETVDSEGNVGMHTSLALDSSNYPHISYYDDYFNYHLKYARWDGAEWQIETVDPEESVGWYTSLALDSSDYPRISYFDYSDSTRDLKYARWDGAAWQIEIVDSEGSVGMYTSLALDSSDYPHISYYGGGDLKYARWNGSSWQVETVDSEGTVGAYTSLALDSFDCPHISYRDFTNSALKYAWYESGPGVEDAELFAEVRDEGVLLGWSITGDIPSSLRVLRSVGNSEPLAIHGNPLPGSATSYLDRKDKGFQPLARGIEYRYWLEVIDNDGLVSRFGPTEPVSIPDQTPQLALGEPYPSPAREAVTIRYELPNGCSGAVIEVYDLSGRRIDTFPLAPQTGRGEVFLDVSEYASGVYTARLSTDEGSVSRRLVITR